MVDARRALDACRSARGSLASLALCFASACGPASVEANQAGAAPAPGPSSPDPAQASPSRTHPAPRAVDGSAAVPRRAAEVVATEELSALRLRVQGLEEELVRARAELKQEAERRLKREEEWLAYTRGIAMLESLAGGVPKFEVDPEVGRRPDAAPSDAPAASEASNGAASGVIEADSPASSSLAASAPRTEVADAPGHAPEVVPVPAVVANAPSMSSELASARLQALLAAESVRGVEVLEVGLVHADHLGPVVLRVRDAAGRVLSVLAADRLRLECSRAGRSVTLVLEHGYEKKSGAKTTFEGGPADVDGRGGVRRVVVADCDPRPWLEGMPFLFRPEALQPAPHDGSISVESLRAALNIKLREDLSAGHWRVEGLGGVQRGVLFEVSLAQLDEKGNRARTLVADRLSIAPLSADAARGVELLLQDGSQVKVDSTTPFLDGRFRLVLPRADLAEWRAARIPLVEATSSTPKSSAQDVEPAPAIDPPR